MTSAVNGAALTATFLNGTDAGPDAVVAACEFTCVSFEMQYAIRTIKGDLTADMDYFFYKAP